MLSPWVSVSVSLLLALSLSLSLSLSLCLSLSLSVSLSQSLGARWHGQSLQLQRLVSELKLLAKSFMAN